jgi:hypothetical protein
MKHSSCFASFVIVAKGDYPSELNITLPFSLVNNNVHKNRLEVMPAYFWMYNLYSLERNSWKSRRRDRRIKKVQHIETDYLAPDTAEEIIAALSFLENLIGKATENRPILCKGLERGKRDQVIIKPLEAVAAYRQMLYWYAVKTVAVFWDEKPELDFGGLCSLLAGDRAGSQAAGRVTEWENIGGQIVPAFRVDALRRDIGGGKYAGWDEIHGVYDLWHEEYPLDKARHAFAVLALLPEDFFTQRRRDAKNTNSDSATLRLRVRSFENTSIPFDPTVFKQELENATETCRHISVQIRETRAKDFRNPFKKATFRNQAEIEQVLGTAPKDAFVRLSAEECLRTEELFARVTARLPLEISKK